MWPAPLQILCPCPRPPEDLCLPEFSTETSGWAGGTEGWLHIPSPLPLGCRWEVSSASASGQPVTTGAGPGGVIQAGAAPPDVRCGRGRSRAWLLSCWVGGSQLGGWSLPLGETEPPAVLPPGTPCVSVRNGVQSFVPDPGWWGWGTRLREQPPCTCPAPSSADTRLLEPSEPIISGDLGSAQVLRFLPPRRPGTW